MTHPGEIELARVTKRFGPLEAVKAIDLTIPGGSYCCLLGPSGCGKTTILRMIAGHETPSEGDVRIGGRSVVGQSPVQRGTAMMFQSYPSERARQRGLPAQDAGHRQARAPGQGP